MRTVRVLTVVLALAATTMLALAGEASAASFKTYVGCSATEGAEPSHVCYQGEHPGAFFESESGDVSYVVCVSFPDGNEHCAREEEEAIKGVLYVNKISTAGVTGVYNVSWSVGSQVVGSWSFSLEANTITLTSAGADATLKANILAESPNATFPPREGSFCPEIYESDEGNYSVCFAEYETGNTWNLVGGQATIKNDKVTLSYGTHTHWQRKWVNCSLRGTHAPGKLISNNGCGRHQPESDVYFTAVEVWPDIRLHYPVRAIGWQFVDSKGFASLGSYHTSKRGRTYTFTNAVGDSFRYRP